MRLHHGLVDLVSKDPTAHFFLQWRVIRGDEAALAGNALDHALALQFRVRLGHSVPIDTQLFGKGPDRRQRLTGFDGPGGCRRPHLVDDLQVHRLAGFETELDAHLSYDSMTV